MNYAIYALDHYWGILVALVVGGGYVLTHRVTAISYAKKKASSLMLAAEKRAEELALTNGADKLNWVINKGYDLLPSMVRLVVSKPLFGTIVQGLFDKAVAFAKAHQVVDASASSPVTQTASAVAVDASQVVQQPASQPVQTP